MIKINATQRLIESMPIKEGDNYKHAKKDIKELLNGDVGNTKLLSSHENMALLRRSEYGDIVYILAVLSKPIDVVIKNLRPRFMAPLQYVGIKEILGLMSASKISLLPATHQVHASWISPKLRGQGYGKALYKVAYENSKRGLVSSNNLGTMSLSIWISLYKSNPNIQLLAGSRLFPKPIARADVVINGLTIEANIGADVVELTKSRERDFYFYWKK